MTREEAILHMILRREELKHSVGDLDEDIKAFDMAIEALEYVVLDQKESYDFAKWVAKEIFDDYWEYNKDAFAELACRKLANLGIVKANGDTWELIESQESEVSDANNN